MSKYVVDIQQELNNIKVTPYGKTMRPNLHDAIEKLSKSHNALSNTFDGLVIDAGNSNAEVVDARNDGVSQPPVQHNTLGSRLDSMQTTINNHLLIPHITYREINVLPYNAVIVANDGRAIVTDDGKAIEKVGNVTKTNTKIAPTDSVKITDLANVNPTDDDLLVIETKNGTASTKVSDLPFTIKYTRV